MMKEINHIVHLKNKAMVREASIQNEIKKISAKDFLNVTKSIKGGIGVYCLEGAKDFLLLQEPADICIPSEATPSSCIAICFNSTRETFRFAMTSGRNNYKKTESIVVPNAAKPIIILIQIADIPDGAGWIINYSNEAIDLFVHPYSANYPGKPF